MLNHLKVFSIACFILITLVPSVSAEDQDTKILIVGDSLSAAYGLLESEGWVTLLENKWRQGNYEIDVVNAAISGDTTQGGLARLPRLLEQHMPSYVYIELGGNDGLRGQSIESMRSNLAEMILLCKSVGATPILQAMQIPPNYGKRYTTLFSDSYDLLSQTYYVALIPFFLQNIALNDTLMQADGIHPNKQAQPLIADFMFTQLNIQLGKEQSVKN